MPRWPVSPRSTLSLVAVLVVALSISVPAWGRPAGSDAGLPKGAALRSLQVIGLRTLRTSPDRALVASLQGLVAKSSPEQIFIDDGGPSGTWKDYLVSRYGITLTDTQATLPSLLTHFKRYVGGYIVYDMAGNPQSLNVATSLSGPLHGLPVDRSQLKQVVALGITRQLLDVSDKTEKWAYQNYRRLFSGDDRRRTGLRRLQPAARLRHLDELVHLLRRGDRLAPEGPEWTRPGRDVAGLRFERDHHDPSGVAGRSHVGADRSGLQPLGAEQHPQPPSASLRRRCRDRRRDASTTCRS